MSNAGQIALGIVGGVAGYFIGGPTGAAYGFQLGLAVGTVVSPTQLPGTYGPRLTDNRTTTSQLGAPIVEVFGTDGVAGTVIWLGDIVEHSTTTEVGGKGGPEGSQTTFSYTQPIAIGLCGATSFDVPMGGILRIWENGKLQYDIREQQSGESDIAFGNRQAASAAYATTFTLYLGDEAQLPDPTIELKEGVGNVTAYRGLMYIVYTDRALRDDQALRHPNFKFEVFDTGSLICEEIVEFSNEMIFDWSFSGNDPRNPCNSHIYQFVNGAIDHGPRASLSLAIGDANDASGIDLPLDPQVLGYGTDSGASFGVAPFDPPFPAMPTDPYLLYCYFNPQSVSGQIATEFNDSGNLCAFLDSIGQPTWWTGNVTSDPITGIGHGYWEIGLAPPSHASASYDCGGGLTAYYVRDWAIAVTRVPQIPPNPCTGGDCIAGYLPSSIPGFCIDPLGRLVESVDWSVDSQTYRVMQKYEGDESENTITKPLNPVRPMGHADDTQAFWEAAYAVAVTAGAMPAGLTYGVEYPALQAFGYTRTLQVCTASSVGVSIATIVRRICEKCTLTDIDVSELETRFVNGYQIGRVMDGRSAIAPLRSVGFFDAVESGGILKFPARGKASVRTLTIDDLGAHAYDSEAPPSVTTRKQQDVELPRQLFVQYRDPDRDYENGEQASPTRLITDAVNDSYVDVAVAIDATQAAQCAEVIWADMWAQRWQHSIAVDCSQTELEPTDCILVPVDGRLERMRIVSVDDSAVILRQLSLVRDDDGSYSSVAIADPPAIAPSAIIIYGTATLYLMDLPALRVEDNDAGIYATARHTTGLTFTAAQVYRSIDDGQTFTQIESIVNEATHGTLDAVFAAGDTTVFDDVTEVFVTLTSGSLESRPDEDVLNGANGIAIGAHGRWEILQFGVAEQIDADQWKLTHLLRGRRGTEHNMGSQVAGDQWVLISGPGIIRLPLENSLIGDDIIYKSVTLGTSYATGVDTTFVSDGEALVPFSPVSITSERDSSDDVIITWIRRDRLGSELPSGSNIAMSDLPESYEVDIYSDESFPVVVRTLSSSVQSVTYTAAQQEADFGVVDEATVDVMVYQISAVVGRGTPGVASIEVAGNPGIVYPEVTCEIALSGTFDTSQEFTVQAIYTPAVGSAVVVNSTVSGAGKASFDDMATELESELDTGMPAAVTVSRVGATVTLVTTAGALNATSTQNAPGMSTSVVQAALPITAAVQSVISIDLFVGDNNPNEIRAPDASAQYLLPGTAAANWRVVGLTWDINKAIGYGVNQNTFWTIPNNIYNFRSQALNDLAPAMLAVLPQYVDAVSFSTGVGSTRPAIIARLQTGYSIENTEGPGRVAGTHPSGYALEIETLTTGVPSFPAGAKQRNTTYVGNVPPVVAGMVATIVLDGTPYTHTITAPEAADPYGAGFATVYTDFQTQIELSGDFDVFIPPGDNTASIMDIERNVVDTPFTCTMFFQTDLVIDITIT